MIKNESWRPAEENIRRFEREVIQSVLPHAELTTSIMIGSPRETPNSFEGRISTFDIFKDTDYEYNGNGKFIHFTSLQSLKAILDFGYLRMSDFGNLADKSELNYGAEVFQDNPIFNLKNNQFKNIIENVFCLSACESTDSTQKDIFIWEVYANKGKGVFIEYVFTQPNPSNFIFGKIQYGIEKLAPLKALKSAYEKFTSENGFYLQKFIESIVELQAFHKSKKYQAENEVRVFYNVKSPLIPNEYGIEKDINDRNEIRSFKKIPLKGRQDSSIDIENAIKVHGEELTFQTFPQIEIKRIMLGYNLSMEQKNDIRKLLWEIRMQHNYEYEIWTINEELEMWRIQ
jgi:hypothetical protein